MGLLLGAAGGFWFALTSVFARIGQRTRGRDDGVFLSVLVNVIVLGGAAALVTRPRFDGTGIAAFVIAGAIAMVGGRSALLRGVRLIGPSRANAMLTGAPAVAAAAGWLALDERLDELDVVGAIIVMSALLLLVSTRSGVVSDQRVPFRHYVVASGAPLAFGIAVVVRKWGLERFPSPVVGAFVGAVAAWSLLVVIDAVRGRLTERLKSNFRPVPWWFVAAGISSSLALLSQFFAFNYISAWVVSILQSTQSIWTVVLSALILKGDDRIDSRLIGAVGLAVTGVVLIAIR